MTLRSLNALALVAIFLVCSQTIFGGNPSYVYYSLDNCASNLETGTNMDYSEFSPEINNAPNCTQYSDVSNIYRIFPEDNRHSCAPGIDDRPAMCVSSYIGCINYEPAYEYAIRFDVTIAPGINQPAGEITGLQFYETAPEEFQFLGGISGPNNYPTLYALRVLVNGEEVFREEGIPTTRDWTLESFDFTDYDAFEVNAATTFNFQLIPYCIVGNGYATVAWDIDEVRILSDCGANAVGGNLSTLAGETEITICAGDGVSDAFDVSLTGNSGPEDSWIITDDSGNILALPQAPPFDLDNAGAGVCNIYNISYGGAMSGLSVDGNLSNLSGCFGLSNPIVVNRNTVNAGSVTFNGQSAIEICVSDGDPDLITPVSVNSLAENNFWVVTDDSGTILALPTSFPIDLDDAGVGICLVYNVGYSGEIPTFSVGDNISSGESCYGLSVPLTVHRLALSGGTISANGEDSFIVCTSDGLDDVINVNVTNQSGSFFQFVVTDEAGVILDVQSESTFNFEGLPEGICLIWHMSYSENFPDLLVDTNVSELTGCFSFSNSITVDSQSQEAAIISNPLGDEFELCINSVASGLVDVFITGNIGTNNAWLITDESGEIVALPTAPPFDLSEAPSGTCRIYNINFNDNLAIPELGNNVSELDGCYGISNAITVHRDRVQGGTISSSLGSSFSICVGDGEEDLISIQRTENIGQFSQWVITDENFNIVDLPDSSPFNLENAPVGICYITSVSHNGDISGLTIGEQVADISGCFGGSNLIEVNRTSTDGGTISTANGTELSFCVGDGQDDFITVDLAGNSGDNSAYVITDELGNIINVTSASIFNFENAPTGNCYIYHISYADDLQGLEDDENINNLIGCHDFSNRITIQRNAISTVSIAYEGGGNSISICQGDDLDDNLSVILTGETTDTGLWIVTDNNGDILDLPSGPPFNFENAGPGVCLIQYVSYAGDFNGADIGENIADLSGCFNVSNPLTVIRIGVNAGTLSTDQETTICVSTPINSEITFNVEDADSQLMTLLVTDVEGNILNIPNSQTVNFGNLDTGSCFVWNMSYVSGLSGLEIGENVSNFSGCYDLSNAIEITKLGLEAPEITTEQGNNITICSGDGINDFLDISTTVSSNFNYWVIVGTGGVILSVMDGPSFNGEQFDANSCRIFQLSALEELDLSVNTDFQSLDACFVVSNPITVIKEQVNGGIISTNGFTTVDVCVNDGSADIVEVNLTNEIGENTQLIITDEDGNILDLPTGSSIDFESAGVGVCLIWNLSYQDGLTGSTIGANVENLDGCYSLSNSIRVNRDSVDGGDLELAGGGTTLTICSGDGDENIVSVELDNQIGQNFGWVITNQSGEIIDLPASPPFNLEGVQEGQCNIYHYALSGTGVNFELGQLLSGYTGCYDLSNPIMITKILVLGGTLTFAENSNTQICYSDNIPETISVSLEGNTGLNSVYLVTSLDGTILMLQNSPDFDFTNSTTEDCQIWHVSYDAALFGAVVGQNAADLVGCYAFSNPIAIIKSNAPKTFISANGGLTELNICTNDNESDLITVLVESGQLDNCQLVLVNENDDIIEISDNNTFDVSGFATSNCQIYNVCYDDDIIGLSIGWPIDGIVGCHTLSNPINVDKRFVEGGTLTTGSGSSDYYVCLGDGALSELEVSLTGDTSHGDIWVITDMDGIILQIPFGPPFEFNGLSEGDCQLWSLAFDGPIGDVQVGEHISNQEGCFDLSTPITIHKETVNGGNLTTSDGLTQFEICAGDGQADPFTVSLTGVPTGSGSSDFIVTNPQGTIISFPTGPTFDFNNSLADTCLLQNIHYLPGLTGLSLGNNTDDLSGCFDLSNPITVIKNHVNGGNLTFNDGTTSTTICSGDNVLDDINVVRSGNTGNNCGWIVTATNGDILAIPIATPINFEGLAGTCQIWNVCYSDDNLEHYAVGFNISKFTGCFDLSNPLTVNKDDVDGGELTTADGETEINICVSDGTSDAFGVSLLNTGNGTDTWIVTDQAGMILDITATPPFDFEGAGAGVCLVWNINFQGGLTGLSVGNNTGDLAGCFDLSNPIRVNRFDGDGPCTAAPIVTKGEILFELYPNPVQDELRLNLKKFPSTTGRIIIYNILGNVMDEIDLQIDRKKYAFDITQYNEGNYFLKIEGERHAKLKKFTKVKM